MPEFVFRSEMPAAAERVFAWHCREGAFGVLVPPWQEVEPIRMPDELVHGAVAEFFVKLGPLRKRWVADHEVSPDELTFVDIQRRGPFRRWRHTHRMIPRTDTTSLLEDRIEYELPGGRLGQLLADRLLQNDLQRMFRYRHDVTRAALRGSTRKDDPMKVLISGASGLIGGVLVPRLTTAGHEVHQLTRRTPQSPTAHQWKPSEGQIPADALTGFDAVIHLAGENIASGRWTTSVKRRIEQSRVQGTTLLSETLAGLSEPPRVLISASAIGYYGDRGDEPLDEQSAAGEGFLAEVCQKWEDATRPAREAGIRTIHARFGLVLSARGGALQKMLLPFRLGLGGVVGSGQQYWSWVAIDDVAGALQHLLSAAAVSGPVNVVAPQPVTNRDFTKTLGKVLHRPTVLPLPGFAARTVLGEMADELLLASQRVEPARLKETGYEFACSDLEAALRHLLGR